MTKSHGWNIDGIEIHEQLIGEEALNEEDTTVFYPAEVELGETIKGMLLEVDRVKPKRVVLDSLSEIRLLAQSGLRYRKQILALKQFFSSRDVTVLCLDDRTPEIQDIQLQSVPHGVVEPASRDKYGFDGSCCPKSELAAKPNCPRDVDHYEVLLRHRGCCLCSQWRNVRMSPAGASRIPSPLLMSRG